MIDPSRFYVIFVIFFFLIQAESEIIAKFCSKNGRVGWWELFSSMLNVIAFVLCCSMILTMK